MSVFGTGKTAAAEGTAGSAAPRKRKTRAGPTRTPPRQPRPRLRGQLEPVQVQHLPPRRYEVADERLPRVVAGVDLRQRPQLRVRPEDEVDGRAGPLHLAGRAVAALVGVLARLAPLRAHVEQGDEEVAGQRTGPVGEGAGLGVADVRTEHAQAAEQR